MLTIPYYRIFSGQLDLFQCKALIKPKVYSLVHTFERIAKHFHVQRNYRADWMITVTVVCILLVHIT